MSGTFFIKKTEKNFFRFSLYAANGKTVLTSQNYATLHNCREGIEAIKKNALSPIEDQTLQKVVNKKYPKYEIYLDTAGQFRYRMMAVNGQNIAISEDGYITKSGCLKGIEAISRVAVDAEIDESTLGK
jgi:uncharacterized protein YegP (UPF0339 family)